MNNKKQNKEETPEIIFTNPEEMEDVDINLANEIWAQICSKQK